MRSLQILYLIITIKSWEVNSITIKQNQETSVRNFRRHIGPSPPSDWELGLREAVHQAFLREHYNDPNLHQHLLQAPIQGQQNIATPFGDIAIIARGQLYLTSHGYRFVQDPYRNDCDECHNNNHQHHQCVQPPCQTLRKTSLNNQQLLALWTVKRIRHRDPNYGHIFELEYTISPIKPIIHEKLLTRNGNFNYNLPGHVFVIKSDPHLNSAHYLDNNAEKHQQYNGKFYQNHQGNNEQFSPISQQFTKTNTHIKPGILIGTSPDGQQHVLHSFPGFYSSYQPQSIYDTNNNNNNNNDQTTIDPKEYELYKKLIESLSGKTSQIAHRFGLTTSKTTTTTSSSTTPTYQENLPYIPAPETTAFLQFPDGNVYQITDNSIRTTTNKYQFPLTDQQTTKVLIPTIQTPTTPYYSIEELPKPINTPTITTIHYFAPVDEDEPTSVTQTTTTTKLTPTTPSLTTTNIDDDFNLFPDIVPTKPMKISTTTKVRTSPKYKKQQQKQKADSFRMYTPITKTIVSTTPQGIHTTATPTTKNKYDEYNNLRPTNMPTKAMDVITQIPLRKKYPNSINEQLPRPEDNLDTTIPYVSTVTVPTIAKTEHFTESSKTSQTQEQISTTQLFTKPTTIKETTPLTTTTVKLTTSEDYTKDTSVITTATTTEDLNETTTSEITTKTTNLPSTTEYMPVILQETGTTTQPTTYLAKTETDLPTTTATQTELRMIKIELTPTPTSEKNPETTPLTATIPITTTTTPLTATIPITTTTTTMNSRITSKYKRKYNRRTKRPKITSTTSDDFLADSSNNSNNNNSKDYDKKTEITNDDIFGKVQIMQTKPPKSTIKKVTKSDLEEALFGDRRIKQIKLTSKLKPRTTTILTTIAPKIIYSDFYQVSTIPSITMYPSPITTNAITTESHPITDQSYSTSISVQVNKRSNNNNNNRKRNSNLKPPPINGRGNNKSLQASPKSSEKLQAKQAFDDLALQLINHVKTIDYFNKKSSKQTNHKRPIYSTNVQQNQRKLDKN